MSASPDTVLVARHDLRDREYAVRIFPGGMLAVALVRRYRHYTSADEFLEDLYE